VFIATAAATIYNLGHGLRTFNIIIIIIIIIIIFFLTPVLNSRGKKKLRYAI